MKILYLIQTHKNPEQIYRLVKTIKRMSPNSYILISHDIKGCYLDTMPLKNFPEVEVIKGLGGRGDFSIIQGYLNALDWLFSHNVQFDWLFNLSGQDYPIQPLTKVEKLLAETKYDGFIRYCNVLSDSDQNPWGSREGQNRYLYQYWRFCESLSVWERAFLKLPRIVVNNVQNLVKINSTYGLMLGIRSTSSPFKDDFFCYAGSYFHTISWKCVKYLYKFCKQNKTLVSYYKKTCIPDESFIQTILLNSGLFNFCNDNLRYYNWSKTNGGSPLVLTNKHYFDLVESHTFFARKFDIKENTKIIDMLEEKILNG